MNPGENKGMVGQDNRQFSNYNADCTNSMYFEGSPMDQNPNWPGSFAGLNCGQNQDPSQATCTSYTDVCADSEIYILDLEQSIIEGGSIPETDIILEADSYVLGLGKSVLENELDITNPSIDQVDHQLPEASQAACSIEKEQEQPNDIQKYYQSAIRPSRKRIKAPSKSGNKKLKNKATTSEDTDANEQVSLDGPGKSLNDLLTRAIGSDGESSFVSEPKHITRIHPYMEHYEKYEQVIDEAFASKTTDPKILDDSRFKAAATFLKKVTLKRAFGNVYGSVKNNLEDIFKEDREYLTSTETTRVKSFNVISYLAYGLFALGYNINSSKVETDPLRRALFDMNIQCCKVIYTSIYCKDDKTYDTEKLVDIALKTLEVYFMLKKKIKGFDDSCKVITFCMIKYISSHFNHEFTEKMGVEAFQELLYHRTLLDFEKVVSKLL